MSEITPAEEIDIYRPPSSECVDIEENAPNEIYGDSPIYGEHSRYSAAYEMLTHLEDVRLPMPFLAEALRWSRDYVGTFSAERLLAHPTTKTHALTTGDKLGEGGMGSVHWGIRWDKSSKNAHPRALKFANEAVAKDRARSDIEALVLSTLTSHGQRIRDRLSPLFCGRGRTIRDGAYIEMELIDGLPLHKTLQGNTPATPSFIAYTLSRFARKLEAIGEHGVLHRDVKPSNIMIEPSTGELIPCDFGVAKMPGMYESALAASGTYGVDFDAAETQTGFAVGTPAYMSPEQLMGSGKAEVGTPSDFYALGLVAFEMFTGKLPYSLDGCRGIRDATYAKQRDCPSEDEALLRRHAPKPLADLVLRMIAFDSTKRPTARECADLLTNWDIYLNAVHLPNKGVGIWGAKDIRGLPPEMRSVPIDGRAIDESDALSPYRYNGSLKLNPIRVREAYCEMFPERRGRTTFFSSRIGQGMYSAAGAVHMLLGRNAQQQHDDGLVDIHALSTR